MTETQTAHLGELVEVDQGRFAARRRWSAPASVARDDRLDDISGVRVGTFAFVTHGRERVLCQITEIRRAAGPEDSSTFTRLLPLGEIAGDGRFSRGLSAYPGLGSPVRVAGVDELDRVFDRLKQRGLDFGRLSQHPEHHVYADPNALFNRHTAILGQTGSGKSWAVSSLIQRTVAAMPRAHIVLLDLHGEYGWTDKDGALSSVFASDSVRHLDSRSLEIPYWLLTYSELVDLLVDRTDPHATLHISFLREVLLTLRRQSNAHLGIDTLSVDSPVYFSLEDLYERCEEANRQQFDFGKRNGPLYGIFDDFLLRFQAMYNDSRYDFLLRPQRRTESRHLEDLMRDFIGLGEPKRQITVIDLSPVPSDVRPTVTAQVGRLAFEFNYWNPRRRDFPILLVCEEAHQYIPNSGREVQRLGSSREMERIAKEGRKYGVGLCVISQRPTELSETVLSQCGTFLCMRMTNPEDQSYVRKLMPQGEQGLADVLATLRRGEALLVGEAVSLPTRFRIYPPNPPPVRNDVAVAEAWRSGPDDLDVGEIVSRWWEQRR